MDETNETVIFTFMSKKTFVTSMLIWHFFQTLVEVVFHFLTKMLLHLFMRHPGGRHSTSFHDHLHRHQMIHVGVSIGN